ncbi:MAG: Protein of unknown function Protein of unknown function [Pedosphaera sp.]|nr:Protein of unknown function Protein of unknown function [Pedosphaera sp.]
MSASFPHWLFKGRIVKRDIRQLIKQKRTWTEPLRAEEGAAGFRGWHSRGYLPHFDVPGLVQLITYRLDDAMPSNRRAEWGALLELKDERQRRIKIEAYLDAGYGECHLRNPAIATLVQDNLLHFDNDRYQLSAWVIMPNHVHVLIEMRTTPLAVILRNWKSFTGNMANRQLGRAGTFWQKEYFDRYIRDEKHLNIAVRYIENNPVKARLVERPEQGLSVVHFSSRSRDGSPNLSADLGVGVG